MRRFEQLRQRLLAEGAVKTREVLADVSREEASALFEALAQAGFERTAQHLRVPLPRQLAALLERERAVPTKQLRGRLAGVENAEELAHVVEQARQSGTAAAVFSEGAEHLTAATDDVLTDAELESLVAFCERLRALLGRTRTRAGSRRSLWRDEVARLFAELGLPARSFVPPAGSVLERIDALHAAGQRLVFVPDLVRATGLAPAAVHAALLEAAAAGEVELRPESGVNNLGAEDAALCPKEGGVVLSYVRRIS